MEYFFGGKHAETFLVFQCDYSLKMYINKNIFAKSIEHVYKKQICWNIFGASM